MTTAIVNSRRKRSNTDTTNNITTGTAAAAATEEQMLYEQAIRDDDMQNFLKYVDSGNVAAASVTAVDLASQSINNDYLDKIMKKMDAKDMRQLLGAKQTLASSTAAATTSSATKISETATTITTTTTITTAGGGGVGSVGGARKKQKTKVTESPVDKVFAKWPFQTARVVWNDKYKPRPSSEKPLEPAESAAKWQELFQEANTFVALGAQKPSSASATTTAAAAAALTPTPAQSQQEQLFDRLEDAAREEKGVKRGADESLEAKFINCRQTARMVFARLLFIEQMNFVVLRRDAASTDRGTKLDFFQLLKKYAVPIPVASSFKGKAQAFATQFQQHVNATVFENKDCTIASIEYAPSSSIDTL